jgi:hypothetical protein
VIRRIVPLPAALLPAVVLLAAAGCQQSSPWASLYTEPIGPFRELCDTVELSAYGRTFCASDASGRLQVAFRTEAGAMGLLALPAEISETGLTAERVAEHGDRYAAAGGAQEAGLRMLVFRPSPEGEGLWVRAWAGPYRCTLKRSETGWVTGTVVLDVWTGGQYAGLPYTGIARATFEFQAAVDAGAVAEVAAALEAGNPPPIPPIERFWMTEEEIEQARGDAEAKRRQWLGLPASRPAAE